jgi:uncharacterized protein
MANERRFVLDVNVIVSAVLSAQSNPRQALDLAQDKGIVLMSSAVFQELSEVLLRPKFDRYSTRSKREVFLENFIETVQLIEVTQQINVCRDAKDNKYLELAVAGDAKFIISGDRDLLVMNPFQGITILRASEFLEGQQNR